MRVILSRSAGSPWQPRAGRALARHGWPFPTSRGLSPSRTLRQLLPGWQTRFQERQREAQSPRPPGRGGPSSATFCWSRRGPKPCCALGWGSGPQLAGEAHRPRDARAHTPHTGTRVHAQARTGSHKCTGAERASWATKAGPRPLLPGTRPRTRHGCVWPRRAGVCRCPPSPDIALVTTFPRSNQRFGRPRHTADPSGWPPVPHLRAGNRGRSAVGDTPPPSMSKAGVVAAFPDGLAPRGQGPPPRTGQLPPRSL